MVDKGKKIAVGKDSTGKRKRGGVGDGDKSSRKNKKPGVLQFFEDAADVDEDDASDDSFFNDLMEEDLDTHLKVKNELGKAHNLPFIPKEEEVDEEEFDKMMEERFKQGSRFINYAEDDYENKRLVERDYRMPSSEDPTMWKVKCMVGRERHSAFCLMQKFADLKSLGTKLQIISAFAVEHVKGFIYVEADKQCDVIEACKGLSGIYSSRMAPVLKNDVSYLLSAQSKYTEVSEGTWAYVKNGKYKGDLAQIVAVNKERKKATVKLIPRIDMQALAAKFGGGATIKKPASAAPRLISSSELEEFRPLIQYRRDRDTGLTFENLDGLMFKDGYLYKKVSMDSLSCRGVAPSEEELLKFAPSENNESADLEWLSQLYGQEKKRQTVTVEKGSVKGEGSSSSSSVNFELYELVCFGRKDFGLIVGMEKDDTYKVLQEGSKGSTVMTVERRNLKNLTSDMKFTAFDHCMKTISVNDTVRVSEGPSKGRQGVVKQIYRGIVFLYDENETENGGYFCSKSQLCEKIKLFANACNEKGGGSGDVGFEEFPSSPKSPLSPKKPWQAKEFNSDFKRGDKDGMFSVGQNLRIRVGPLKGYLCRVLAIRYSDVTVKLDSQQKVLTVRSEHLAEVRGKSFGMSTSEEPGSSSFKPFDLLGTEGGSGDWTNGAGTSAEGDRWNAGGPSAERSSWPSFPAAENSLPQESSSWGAAVADPKKDVEDSAWGAKGTANQNSSWGAAVADGKNDDCWNKAADKNIDSDISASGSWGKPVVANGNPTGSSHDPLDNWGAGKLPANSPNDASASWGKNKDADDNQDSMKKSDSWDKGKNISGSSSVAWGDATAEQNQQDSWGKGKGAVEAGATVTWEKVTGMGIQEDCWGKAAEKHNTKDSSNGRNSDWNKSTPAAEHTDGASGWKNAQASSGTQTTNWVKNSNENETGTQDGGLSWSKQADQQGSKHDGGSSWGKQDGGRGSSWGKQDGGSSQGKQDGGSSQGKQDGGSSWGKQEGGSSQGKQDGGGGGSSWGKQDGGGGGGSSWGKQDGGGRSSWGKQDGGAGSSWGKQDGGSSLAKQDGGSSWGKQEGGSSWGKQDGGRGSSWGKQDGGGGSSWGKQDGGSSWGKQDGGSSWSKQDDQQDGLETARSFDGGRGSGGRWGRGRGRGGRDHLDRGRSFGQGQSTSWKDSPGNNWTSDGSSSGNQSSWKEPNASGEDTGAGWKRGWSTGKETCESGDKWDSAKPSGGNWSTQWKKESVTNEEPSGYRNEGKSWDSGNKASSGDHGTRKSNWNSGSGDGDRKQGSGWGQKNNWNSESSGASENHNWGNKGNWNSASSDAGQNQEWNTGSNNSNQDSSWGKKVNWNAGSGGGNQDSNWAKKTDWNSGNEDRNENRTSGGSWRGGSDGRDGSGRGSFRGRGGSDRGGYGGRGRSDRGGYGGRGGSGRGGYGGRDGSDRGFGGRGRGRRDQDDWGTKNNDGAGSWNHGGSDNSQGKSWHSGNTGASNQAGGWSGQSSGWTQTTGAKDAGGSLNKGGDATNTGGWSQGNNWKSSDTSSGWGNQGSGNASGNNDQPKSWNQSNAADGGQSSGWGKSKDTEGSGGGQGSSWGKGSDGSGKGGW
ncbi:hypothetical protein ACOSP7_032918 [Xanthoceras sorbifolium]